MRNNDSLATVQANLMALGYCTFETDGIKLTEKGKDMAWQKWMELPGEDRLLFGWLIRTNLAELGWRKTE